MFSKERILTLPKLSECRGKGPFDATTYSQHVDKSTNKITIQATEGTIKKAQKNLWETKERQWAPNHRKRRETLTTKPTIEWQSRANESVNLNAEHSYPLTNRVAAVDADRASVWKQLQSPTEPQSSHTKQSRTKMTENNKQIRVQPRVGRKPKARTTVLLAYRAINTNINATQKYQR